MRTFYYLKLMVKVKTLNNMNGGHGLAVKILVSKMQRLVFDFFRVMCKKLGNVSHSMCACGPSITNRYLAE